MLPQDVGEQLDSTECPVGPANICLTMPLREAREAFERDYIAAQLGRFGGNISRTAQFIGMERSALHRKIKLLGLLARHEEEPT